MRSGNLHACYVLTMDEDTTFADLLTVSSACVRRIYPEARITILTDDESLQNFARLPQWRSLLPQTISVGEFSGSPRMRSRFVKTRARSVIDGDFLFLDADTVAVSAFDDVLHCDAPISAAIDRNRITPLGGFPEWVKPEFARLGWRYPTRFYLNSGVVFWKDCDETRALGRLWHDNWLTYSTTVDNPADQPAFNYSIDVLGIEPKIMNDAFNARVGVSPTFANGARIYHLLSGDERPKGTFIDELLRRFCDNGEVDFSLIDDAVRLGPWLGVKGNSQSVP